MEVKSYKIISYDLGGEEKIRDIWTNYYAEVSDHQEKKSKISSEFELCALATTVNVWRCFPSFFD